MKAQNIYLPHINYTVKVRQFKTPPDGLERALAYVEHDDSNTCTMYLDMNRTLSAAVGDSPVRV